jgi:galactokinase
VSWLLDTARAVFAAEHGGAPARAWRVPGRLEVVGKHTDYAGGRSLVGALSRGFVVLAAPRGDGEVRVVDARGGRTREPTGTARRSHVDVVVDRLTRNFPGAREGATIVFASDLPRAAGMSSSSALVTGITVSLAAIWNLESRDEWRANIPNQADLASYCASIENGRTFGTLEGDAGVGTSGGGEDHAAILLAKAGQLSSYSFVPFRHLADVRLPDQWRFVIATSGVAASKAGAARDDYNRLSRGADVLLELWNRSHAPCGSLAAALASSGAAGDELRGLIRGQTPPGWRADALERRLAHFEIEDVLVVEAVQAIQCADALAIGAVADASQQRAELLLGNQIPETIALARLARPCGAFAASSFGAGFGGSVWALVERERAGAFARRWLAAYRQECAAGARAEVFVAALASGLADLAVTS